MEIATTTLPVVDLSRRYIMPMTATPRERREAMVIHLGDLRAFAVTLTRDQPRADDMVERAIVQGWNEFDTLAPGACIRAWLFTMVHDLYFTDPQNTCLPLRSGAGLLKTRIDFGAAFDDLPVDQREALVLIGAAGFSLDQAAEICGTAPRVVKKRADSARARLALALSAMVYDTSHPKEPTTMGERGSRSA